MDFIMGYRRLLMLAVLVCGFGGVAYAAERVAGPTSAESAVPEATGTSPPESNRAESSQAESTLTEPTEPEPTEPEPTAAQPDPAALPAPESAAETVEESNSEAAASSSVASTPELPRDTVACEAASATCLASCKRFRANDARLPACENFCRTRANDRPTCIAPNSIVQPDAAVAKTWPTIAPLSAKKDTVRALETNGKMLVAIRAGNLKAIRRLIEVDGLHPTYVYAYDYNTQIRQYDGRIAKLRLRDIFDDANTLRNDNEGLDRILALFIELGLDVAATLPPASGSEAPSGRTAWGPNLKLMETARDRGARMRAFELALQNGLVPNDDFSEWLFAELPQVCGRDKSKFAIEVTDLLIRYLGPAMKDNLWRSGARGPETVADVLDLSFAPPQAKYEYQKKQFAQQDIEWENCALLSRRINRFLTAGN